MQYRPVDRPGRLICIAINPGASPDAAELRIEAATHGRFNPASLDPDVAERSIVQFAQRFDGLAVREIGDDDVHPASEDAE
jgi:hypothetical protein